MMGRIALRGVRAHGAQLVLSVLAVTIGVAFVTGTFALRAMLATTFDGIVASSVQADAYVRGASPPGTRSRRRRPRSAARAVSSRRTWRATSARATTSRSRSPR